MTTHSVSSGQVSSGIVHNPADYGARYPNAPVAGGYCAPRVESGPLLLAVRRRLRVLIDGAVAGVTLADRHRDDLVGAKLGEGGCGFSFPLMGGLTLGRRHVIEVRRCELAGPRVTALGHVPDLHALFGRVRLSVASLRFGAGLKGKVLDSLAAGIPCVMSPVAAEGLALPPSLRGLVTGDPAALAAAIIRMHADRAANRQASLAGLRMVAAGFQPRHVQDALRGAIGSRRRAA